MGRGRKFGSGREWSARAGLSPSAVSSIETTGRATCEKLITLARAACEQPLPVLVLAGWLTEEEAELEAASLTEEEHDLLCLFRLAMPTLRHATLELLRVMREEP